MGELAPEKEGEDHSSNLFTNVRPEEDDDAVVSADAHITPQSALKELEEMAKQEQKKPETMPEKKKVIPSLRTVFCLRFSFLSATELKF